MVSEGVAMCGEILKFWRGDVEAHLHVLQGEGEALDCLTEDSERKKKLKEVMNLCVSLSVEAIGEDGACMLRNCCLRSAGKQGKLHGAARKEKVVKK